MRFSTRIFVVLLGIYVAGTALTGIIVTERSYRAELDREIQRSLSEQESLYRAVSVYLLVNSGDTDVLELNKYAARVVRTFAGSKDATSLELLDAQGRLLAYSNPQLACTAVRPEIQDAIDGPRNFILRWVGERHLLYITEQLTSFHPGLILVVVRDITAVDNQRLYSYWMFARIGVFGGIIAAIISWLVAYALVKPLQDLQRTASSIAAGNLDERVRAKGSCEVVELASQFNAMVDQLQESLDQLQAENLKKQRFVDSLTHELRTPLTAIIGYAELLERRLGSKCTDVERKCLRYIQSEGKRLLQLAETLLEITLARQKLITARTAVYPLLQEVAAVLEPKARAKAVSIKVVPTEAELELDRELMQVALLNIVDNAIKASPCSEEIVIYVCEAGSGIRICVQDYGQGLTPEQAAKVFEPFYRVDTSRSRTLGGAGLGLALVREIVEAHGARINITSTPGVGTLVSVIF